MASAEAMIRENIEIMNRLEGFSVVIICCSSALQAAYWQQRLDIGAKGSVIPLSTLVFSVEEDWPGGAGNALGTLYAVTKAAKLAAEKHSMDLLGDLSRGKISIGLFHTAGKGTRLAPLPGSENNNKPGVKLPATINIGEKQSPMTILEGVIKQTGCYAKSRMGRLSVFWGDQVFIPTVPVEYTVTHHVDILCSLGPMMSEEEWKAKGMEKYGLIAQAANGAAQVEKVSHATAVQLLASLGDIQSVGPSLGSFSISSHMLQTLLNEFSPELAGRKGKLDSDPHLWMPMTLEKSAYLQLMQQKGIDEAVSTAHFDRIARMMQGFWSDAAAVGPNLGLFGPVDVGQGVYWWDYGQLKLYHLNTMMLTERTKEAELMRLFLGITEERNTTIVNTAVDETSCISACSLGSAKTSQGTVRNSVLSNVRCNYIEADNSVLINVTADRIIAKNGSIIYNVCSDGSVGNESTETNEREVKVSVFNENGGQLIIQSSSDIDGGKQWETRLPTNAMSFEEVYNANASTCPTTLEKVIEKTHNDAWAKLST